MTDKKRAVIFDVGNVLLRWDARLLFRQLLPDDAAVDAFIDEVGFDEWNLALDAGLSWEEGVAQLSERHPHHAVPIRAFHERWHETVSGTIDGSVTILRELAAAGVPLYAITNFSAEKWDETLPRFPFLANSFRDVVVSGRLGVTKPDPAIYHALLDPNDLEPEACIFIDDSQKNIAGAAALGIDAILFTTPESLRDELVTRGLLTPPAETA